MAAHERIRHLPVKLLVFAGLCLLPALGSVQMALRGESWIPLLMYPLISLLTLLMYWRDKHYARAQTQRISEKALHVSELFGGWPGALVAQQLFRHKTRKLSYQAVFWAVVLIHQALWIDYQFMGRQGLILG